MLGLFSNLRIPCSRRRWPTTIRATILSIPQLPRSNQDVSRRRWYSDIETENINVAHSRFLAESSPDKKWNGKDGADTESPHREIADLPEDKGKLSSTSSHLFKLILPLGKFQKTDNDAAPPPPTVFLLHPSQPLSHLNRLIAASLTPFPSNAIPPTVAFRGKSHGGSAFQWADSTDVAHFVRDAGRASEFSIAITPPPAQSQSDQSSSKTVTIDVLVPTLADRTRFLHMRLRSIDSQLSHMDGIKRLCDREAHKGARRVALSGFGVLVVYWTSVARLTFWDYGWDVMEPITYLSGLTTVICGYLWFLYQGREVSYTSLLDRTITSRREQQYKARGLDIEKWAELVEERKRLRREISRIEADYGEGDGEESGSSGGKYAKGSEKEGEKNLNDGKSSKAEKSRERKASEREDSDDPEAGKKGEEDSEHANSKPKSDKERAVMSE